MKQYRDSFGRTVRAWYFGDKSNERIPEELYYHEKTPVSIVSQFGGEIVWAERLDKTSGEITKVPTEGYFVITPDDRVLYFTKRLFEDEFKLVRKGKHKRLGKIRRFFESIVD